jgi:flagellar biosynthetic protein FliR/FlhB
MRQIPAIVKVGLSLIIGMLVSGLLNTANIVIPSSYIELFIVVSKELVIGLSIGFIATLIFNAIRVSAQLMDFSIGFSMASYYDPSTAGNSTPLERIFNWIAIVIFLTFNFHHIILSAIIKSFEVVPPGIFTISTNMYTYIISVFAHSFYTAMQLAAPIVIVLFITDFTMGLISRTVPQFNIFMLNMPLKVLVGFLAISAILPGLTHMYVKVFEGMSTDILKFFNTFPVILLMASDDKTEEPTPKKIQEAKKKGQVPKSVDLNSAFILLSVTMIFLFFGNFFYNQGNILLVDSFKYVTKESLSFSNVNSIFIYMVKNILLGSAPIILTVMVVGVASNIIQTGPMFTSESLKPKFEKINPLEGAKRFFSKRTIIELLKSIAKIALISYISFSFVSGKINEILKTSDLSPKGIFPFVKSITDSQLTRLVLFMFVVGIIDFVFQKRQFKKDMRMTKQEVREEYKQMEGDPQIKSRIRQKQREMATRRMMHEVPKATVVVTNPTHFAVALSYNKDVAAAPIIVAKGMDLIALKIKEIAKENNVPIVENRPLARALYAKADINQQVPVELYQAVAEIIAYVYSMKKM